jgi:thioredoxin 1
MSTPLLILDEDNRARVSAWLEQDEWVVACLCAAWCDTCRSYQAGFAQLAELHPDKHFVWIDIEDQADLVGDIDVENFPTLLIQHRDAVAFVGTVLPDLRLAERLLLAQVEKSDAELLAASRSALSQEFNLRTRLRRQ